MRKTNYNAKKSKGRVYTPDYMVRNILDSAHYSGENMHEETANIRANSILSSIYHL